MNERTAATIRNYRVNTLTTFLFGLLFIWPFSACAMHLLKRNHIKNINQQPALHAIEQKKKDSDVWLYYSCALRMCCAHVAECVSTLACECSLCLLFFLRLIKGWHCGDPLLDPPPCHFPLVSPCPQRGGRGCDLPPTHNCGGRGRPPPHWSVRKGVAKAV